MEKLRYKEIYKLSSLFNIIRMDKSRKIKSVGHGEKINMYKILARMSKRKIPHGRHNTHKWKDNIKMFLRQTGCGRDSGTSEQDQIVKFL
jgi:hypothetical protein